jgi:hypothetical protein
MTPLPWHFTTWLDLLDHWQTIIAGVLALAAAVGTILVTRRIANMQIAAARKQADRMVAAAREQTSVTAEQTSKTIYLARMRDAGEAAAFRTMLEAAMTRVIAEVAWVRSAYPQLLTRMADGEALTSGDALTIRSCITKGAFEELRDACVRQGSPLTGKFLDLEREIDNFALQWEKISSLGHQLELIEAMATELRDKAVAGMGRANAVIAAPGPFATAEAEALIGAPAPPVSAPKRRSWIRYWFGWRKAG